MFTQTVVLSVMLTNACLYLYYADIPEPLDPQICQAICAIMKLSFEEDYRRAMNELGNLNNLSTPIYHHIFDHILIAPLTNWEKIVYGSRINLSTIFIILKCIA